LHVILSCILQGTEVVFMHLIHVMLCVVFHIDGMEEYEAVIV
jgi:hypothetical protein